MIEDNKTKRIVALIFGGLFIVIVIPIIFYFISRSLDHVIKLNRLLPIPFNWVLGLPIAIFGASWSLISNIQLFIEGKGGPIPRPSLETTKLVIKGVYKYSRNPKILQSRSQFYYLFDLKKKKVWNLALEMIMSNIKSILLS
ncbi:MAG: hypothetical protein ACTSQI_20425 [Candidatus Helarchaeota archaeon]